MNWAILRLYCDEAGTEEWGYYNSQELGLARALAAKGIPVTIVYPEINRKNQQLEEENGISILRIPCRVLGTHAFYKLDFLQKRNIDVVHLNSDNQMFAPGVMKFCRKHHIFFYNYVGTLYSDTDNFVKKVLMNIISARNIRFYRKNIVVAKTISVEQTLRKKGVSGIETIHVGLDVTQIRREEREQGELRKELGLPEGKKLLLFVGRLEQYKRPFAALELLKKLGERYHLVLVGTGSLREQIEEKACRDKLDNQISYLGRIPNTLMYQYYSACDYYVNFNTHEIFGMSILEAMYQECTVVARRAPGPEEIIENGISGHLCGSEEEMAAVIQEGEERKTGREAGIRISEHFTWEKSAEQFLTLVRDRR